MAIATPTKQCAYSHRLARCAVAINHTAQEWIVATTEPSCNTRRYSYIIGTMIDMCIASGNNQSIAGCYHLRVLLSVYSGSCRY